MKIIVRLLKWPLFSLLGLLVMVFILLALDHDYHPVELSAMDKKAIKTQRVYVPDADPSLYDSLLSAYGKNKTLAKGFERQCLLALSHYPELKETPIVFVEEPALIPLSSRPAPLSVLFPWIRRKYLVIISNRSNDFFDPILLRNTPFNDQVGVIGHELAHTVYYEDKSALQLAYIGFCYLFESFNTDFERATDKRAIAHGLGYQLYDFGYYARRAFGESEKAIEEEEGDTYLSPKEMWAEMQKYDFYKVKP